MLVGSSKPPAPGPKPGGTNDATKPTTRTVADVKKDFLAKHAG